MLLFSYSAVQWEALENNSKRIDVDNNDQCAVREYRHTLSLNCREPGHTFLLDIRKAADF